MSSPRKTYFLAPTLDTPPSGPIRLGALISSPASPDAPLSTPLPILSSQMPISTTHKSNWTLELSAHKSGRLGLWASFLQIVGVGGDLSVGYSQHDASVYAFKCLETQTFYPTASYVKDSVMAPEVQAFLKAKRFKENVYMITAISVAVGADVASETLRGRGVHTHFGLDGTAAGVPVQAGPDVDVGWGGGRAVRWSGGSDFVFAFRVREVCYWVKRGMVDREFTRGALFGLGEGPEREEKGVDVKGEEEKFELLGVGQEDVSGEEVGGEGREAVDEEGEVCECVVLKDGG